MGAYGMGMLAAAWYLEEVKEHSNGTKNDYLTRPMTIFKELLVFILIIAQLINWRNFSF